MSKRLFVTLIIFMSLSLLGIIFVQVYWIRNAVETENARLDNSIREVIQQVANDLVDKEEERFYQLYWEISDSLGTPDRAMFREYIITLSDPGERQEVLYASGMLEENYKMSANIFAIDADSIDYKKYTGRKYYETLSPGPDGPPDVVSRDISVEEYDEPGRYHFRETMKGLTRHIPLHRRVNREVLDELIRQRLGERNLNPEYEFAIYSKDLATTIVSDGFEFEEGSMYSTLVFGNRSRDTDYKLWLNYSRKEQALSAISGMAVLSLVLTAIIVLTYYGAVMQLLRQKQISEIKTDFINNMTHEFKTPIATINLALDAVKNPAIQKDKESVERYLKMIGHENKRMHAQVENVLRISKLDRGALNLEKKPLDLHSLVENAIDHIGHFAEERGGYMKKHLDAESATVLGHEMHLISVITNILDNAVKYSTEAPEVDVYTKNEGNHITLKVADKGIGISKAAQKRVFEKFYREHTGDVHNVKGHGLGLSYVKRVLDDHQAGIAVESEKGKGSIFSIKMKLAI